MRTPRFLLLGALLLGACTAPRTEALPPLDDRAAWHARLGWAEACEQARREDPATGGPGIQLHALGGERYLVEVECFRGAYQGAYHFVLYDRRTPPGRATPVRFPVFDGERWSWEAEVAGEPSFHPEAKELELFSRARGVGDCGQVVRYGFSGGEPELLRVRVRECPPGPPQGPVPPPREWPLVPPESIPAPLPPSAWPE